MAFMLQISDPEDLVITMSVPGRYNPDVLDDLKRRTVDAYREVLSFRHAIVNVTAAGAEDDGE